MSKILIVDDRLLNRQLLVKLLSDHHHLAWEAADGAEALQIASLERPDLIISDVLMPTMDGYEFVRQLRADPIIGQTPVIFITGSYLGRESRALAESCGISSIIYRPCDQEEVLRNVDATLGSSKHPETILPLKREELDREHLQLLTDTLSEKSDQLSAVNLKLTALIELSQRLASERDPLKLLNGYCRAAREIIGAKWNALGVLSEDNQTLQHFYTIGLDDEIAKRLNPLSLVEGMFGKLLKDSSPYRIRIMDDAPQTEGWPPDLPPLSSCLGLPIIFQERVSGWICLANKLGAEEFSDEDEQLAVTLVAQMAAAYENAILYSEAQHRTIELEWEIAHRKLAEEAVRAKNEELTAMTQQFWQASKLATMGELAASIAHELNNPLATVSLRTESLLGQFADDDPKQRALKIIEQEVERMSKLVGNLLQFSRRNHQQISTIDVYQEIESTLDFIEHYLCSHQINVVREFADALPTLHADRQQLRQVFLNVLTNASDAMTQGGTLTLRVAAGQTEHGEGAIVIEFADTGSGIKPEDLLKVWEPFFTTKGEGKGTGLGLAICRRIVEEHKGTINLESELGQGTIVRITLPALEREGHETRNV